MKPEWVAAIFMGVWVAAAAVRGTITEPGTWVGVILAIVVSYLALSFMQGGSEQGTASRQERWNRFAVTRPWRAGPGAGAIMFALWMALSPLFDRPYTAAFWGLALGSAAVVVVFYVGVAYLARWQQR